MPAVEAIDDIRSLKHNKNKMSVLEQVTDFLGSAGKEYSRLLPGSHAWDRSGSRRFRVTDEVLHWQVYKIVKALLRDEMHRKALNRPRTEVNSQVVEQGHPLA